MEFYSKNLITVIAASICFLLEVKGANTTPESTSVSYPGDTTNDRICAYSPPATGGWFGIFKTDLADEFDGDAVDQMVTYFNLPPKKEQVKQANNKGLELLSVLEDSGTIGEKKGIDELCEALKFCDLNRLSQKATELFNHPSKDIPENILPACVCGQNSYKELKSHSDGSVVSLQCNICAAEWFPTTESSTEASLVWKGKKFSYKIPRELDLSELKHEQVKDVNELQHGDHIVFRRYLVLYDHHAIFLHISKEEEGKIKVIHWTGPPSHIECEDVWFPTGGVRRVQYPKSDPADVVVARAYDMLYNSSQVYDLANNNCESLATFCKIGKAFSIQGKVVGDVLPLLPKVLNKCFKNVPDLSLGAQSLNSFLDNSIRVSKLM